MVETQSLETHGSLARNTGAHSITEKLQTLLEETTSDSADTSGAPGPNARNVAVGKESAGERATRLQVLARHVTLHQDIKVTAAENT